MRRYARTLAVALGLAATSVAPSVHAQEATPASNAAADARTQYQLGTQAFQQRRYAEAALHFESAASLRTSAVALYTAGLAWDNAGRPERAADAYSRSLEIFGLDAKQAELAKDRVAQLERTLGTLSVIAPAGWRVQLDTFTEALAPARLHGPPGPHALSVRAPGKPIERRDVSLEAGKAILLELKDGDGVGGGGGGGGKGLEPGSVGPAPTALPPPSPFAAESSAPFWITRRVVGLGIATAGVASLLNAVVLEVNASSANQAYEVVPTPTSLDHVRSLETWSHVTLIAGAVLLAGGATLLFWPSSAPASAKSDGRGVRVGPAPGGAVVVGTF